MRIFLLLLVFLVVGCAAPSGPKVVTLNSEGIVRHSGTNGSTLTWSEIKGLHVNAHPISEEGKPAQILRVVTEKGRQEICSQYPKRMDPKSYGGQWIRISVKPKAFEAIKGGIIQGAGLVSKGEGIWEGGGEPQPVEEASFGKGIGKD